MTTILSASTTTTTTTTTASASPTPSQDVGLMANPVEQLKQLAQAGQASDKILRGFFLGVAIGIPIALACCCWYPCFSRETAAARRQRIARQAELLVPPVLG